MFENGERSELLDIDPAGVRLRGYGRRNLNMTELHNKIDGVQVKDKVLLKDKREAELDDARRDEQRGLASTSLG